jgi:hypothetical protein
MFQLTDIVGKNFHLRGVFFSKRGHKSLKLDCRKSSKTSYVVSFTPVRAVEGDRCYNFAEL